jgi:hypothetical protein
MEVTNKGGQGSSRRWRSPMATGIYEWVGQRLERAPVDFPFRSVFRFEPLVGFNEVAISEESFLGGIGRWMLLRN